MQKIIPHIWYDKDAKAAAEFYVTVFPNSKITNHYVLKGSPSGDCDVMSFDLMGLSFMSISAGPYFKLNPSISIMVNFDPSKDKDAATRIDEVYGKLMEGGKALMPIGEYPFSKRYAWVEDRFGMTWQLILTNPAGEPRPAMIPSLLFTGDMSGKAKEASDYYLSVFKDSRRGGLAPFPADTGMGQKAGDLMFTDFSLGGTWLTAMDGGTVHSFGFNEALSFMVNCDTQEEIDYFWSKLSAVPESEQCGWCKDRFGVSWQVIPRNLEDYMRAGTEEQRQRVVAAFMPMKKFDLAALERAYKGE